MIEDYWQRVETPTVRRYVEPAPVYVPRAGGIAQQAMQATMQATGRAAWATGGLDCIERPSDKMRVERVRSGAPPSRRKFVRWC